MEGEDANTPSAVAPSVAKLLERYTVDPAVRRFALSPHRLLIDGRWQDGGSGARLDVFEASTGSVLTTITAGDEADIDLAVQAARRAMADQRWSGLSPAARERTLHRLAELIEREADLLATLETLDNGKPIVAAREIDVPDAIAFARYMAGWPTKIDGRTVPLSAQGAPLGLTIREPVGVVGAITPWNYPLNMAVQKVMPALAAGCAVVLKPAEQTSLTALRLGELALESGLPDGVLNVVTGTGTIAGAALAHHPDVAKLTFTGSTATGIRVGLAAMANMTRVTLELGGKSPMIVLPDCDLDRAAQGVVDGVFFNAGQVCSAASRLYVHRSVHDALLDRVEARAAALRLGPGLDPTTDMGPLVSAEHRAKVCGYIDLGRAEGAGIRGGDEWDGQGYFVRPTVFGGVAPESRLLREEIFGPVVVASSFDTQDEALRLANDSRYGLAASIWSNDMAAVRRLAGGLRAGTVWVNAHNPVDPVLPFGGFGLSGFGREGGPETLDAYLETKALWIAS